MDADYAQYHKQDREFVVQSSPSNIEQTIIERLHQHLWLPQDTRQEVGTDLDAALVGMRARQTEILQALGEGEIELTDGLIDELAALETILGDCPLEEVFRD